MPVLHNFSSSRILIYAGDHLLPHVHIQLKDGRECTVEIDRFLITGRIKRHEIRAELKWIQTNRFWLHEEWKRLNP
jgi:hypothetical protein